MAAPRTIVLQGELSHVHEERVAGAAGIVPGDCLEYTADNEAVIQATDGADAPVLVAKEDDLQGKTIDDAYADEDIVFVHRAQKGDKLYLRLAASQTITIGSLLQFNGAGKVKALGTGKAKFQAAEAVTTGVGETARIKVYVI
jgi:hypothetical protein